MQDALVDILGTLKKSRIRKTRIISILLVLSLLVSLDVFWVLRKPGLTLAGDADCKVLEHTHDDECQGNGAVCDCVEHIHSIDCYSDKTVDTESPAVWQKMFADFPYSGELRKDLIGIAKTQVGYSESKLNFEVGNDGVRRGYTRYGAWYGMPYRDWSAAFVSFCLNYAHADPEKNPGNTGGASMAELWKSRNKYVPKGAYIPVDGDLVFFNHNTVGIVARVYNASMYVIRGDVNDTVCGSVLSIADSSIIGWGVTEGDVSVIQKPNITKPTIKDPTDIINGPQFSILAGSEQERMQGYSLRFARTITDLLTYLNSVNGKYSFTLLDINNQELPKDSSGNYIAYANTKYKLTLTVNSPDGFHPGTYQYQIPHGLLVDGGEGVFELASGTEVGTWSVTNTGLITMEFNEHMNVHTDITISATMGIHFYEQDEPLDFDGKITVNVDKPQDDIDATVVNKWGSQGVAANNTKNDPTKLYWTVEITGHSDSQIPGSVVSDQALVGDWMQPHKYTPSDIAAGISVGASEYDPETGLTDWHNWMVYEGDPALTWTETGWTYTFPKTVTCMWCGEIDTGNEGWVYYIDYSSTPTHLNTPGTLGYANQVNVDGQTAYGWGGFVHSEIQGVINKQGDFIAGADGGSFLWEIQATIPPMNEGEKADYFWYIMDNMYIEDENGKIIEYTHNDADTPVVTATVNGVTITVPNMADATVNDPYAWYNEWSPDMNGVYYGRQISLLCRCNCTEENCELWTDGSCHSRYWWCNNDYCQCWTATETTVFTLTYQTDALDLINKYGGTGYKLINDARLYYKPTAENSDSVSVSSKEVGKTIPNLLDKELVHDFDGYTATYKITVNEAKIPLTNGGSFTIHDVMTQTLAYIAGSMTITTEDEMGVLTTLTENVDYIITYDGTGNIKNEKGEKVHTLDIEILHPQPVMYILDFDTMLIVPSGTTTALKYANSASISLWGAEIADTSAEKVYADINISAKNYMVEMHKISATNGKYLSGATFGLFNEQGNLITTGTTGSDGIILFKTNIVQGIILREHVLYYTQELKAPKGYALDETKHWFCFCDSRGESCGEFTDDYKELETVRIPFETVGHLHIMNEPQSYILPDTGGIGTYPIILVSVIFIVTPLVYRFIQKRKQERRRKG